MSATSANNIQDVVKEIRILVVEDEEALLDALVFEFERIGFLVAAASNGKKALEIMQAVRVDVVISDILMPVLGGIELLERIKKINPNLPIVMLMTGFADITSEEAKSKGVEALFSKPFDRKALVESVMKLVVSKAEQLSGFSGSVRADLKAHVKFNGDQVGSETRVLSLYKNGIFVFLKDHFPQMSDQVSLDLFFDEDEPWLGASGVVKWVSFSSIEKAPSGVGIEFFGLSEARSAKIESLIRAKSECTKSQ